MYKNKLNKVLLSEKPSVELYEMIKSGQMYKIIPEVIKMKGFNQHTPYHDKDVLEHTMAVVDSVKPKLSLRMAALLHDICKPDCFTQDKAGRGHFYGHHIKSAEQSEIILKRLGYDREFIDDVKTLIRYHYIKDINESPEGARKLVDSVGEERIYDMIELIKADTMGKAMSPRNMETAKKIEILQMQVKKMGI